MTDFDRMLEFFLQLLLYEKVSTRVLLETFPCSILVKMRIFSIKRLLRSKKKTKCSRNCILLDNILLSQGLSKSVYFARF